MDKIPSFKKFFIGNYTSLTTYNDFKHKKIIILTATGIIEGTLSIKGQYPTNESRELLHISLDTISKNYKSTFNIESSAPLKGNDGLLALDNVTLITNNGAKINFENLIVFFDEIIAITLDNIT